MEASKTFFDQLRLINSVARTRLPSRFACTSVPSSSKSGSSSTPPPVKYPTLNLPLPTECASTLVDEGYPRDFAQEASDSILRASMEYRATYEAAHRSRSADFVHGAKSDPGIMESFQRFIKIIEGRYQSDIAALQQHTFERLSRLKPRLSTKSKQLEKPAFNQDYLPYLENFFIHNAYPNTKDCEILARKTVMTTDQIRNWFQNHRSRARKEGKIPKRPYGELASVDAIERHERQTVPPKEGQVNPFKRQKCLSPSPRNNKRSFRTPTSASQRLHPFEITAPPHAFPAPYPPGDCGYDPFPRTTSLPAPVWYRTPAQYHPPSTPKTVKRSQIDELCADFNRKLHLKCSMKKQAEDEHPTQSLLWNSGTVTIALHAPHPALIRTSAHSMGLANPGVKKGFQIPLRPETRLPMSTRLESAREETNPSQSKVPRKVSRLATRRPRHSPKSHSDAAITNNISSSPSPSLGSPKALFTSISSMSATRRRSSSSSSGSSTASSDLLTPAMGLIHLPGVTLSQVPDHGLDDQWDSISVFHPTFSGSIFLWGKHWEFRQMFAAA